MSEKGFDVVGLSRNPGDSQFRAIECDVSSFNSVKNIATLLKSEGVRVTGLVNCAGIASMNLAMTTPPEVTSELLGTNLAAQFSVANFLDP